MHYQVFRFPRLLFHPFLRFCKLLRRRLKTTILTIFIACCIIFYLAYNDSFYLGFGEDSPEYLDYIAKTASCKLPKINPFHESILPYIKELAPLDCGKSISTFEKDTLRVEGDNIVSVYYRTLTRPDGNDNAVNISEPIEIPNLLNRRVDGKREKDAIKPGGYGCIMHNLSGKCLHPYGGIGLPNGLQPVVFHENCCEKTTYFQMEKNGAIKHVQSNRCIRQKIPGKSSAITLHQKCDTRFEVIDGYLKLKGKNLCLQPASRRDDPANNEEIVLDENCDKDRHSFYFDFLEGTQFKGAVTVNTDFVRVEIKNGGTADDVIETHMQTTFKKEVEERKIVPAGIPVDIVMIMFDSTSAANFLRKMPNTYKYLKETLNTVFLNGQTIVGDGTTAQLSAILTGRPEHHQPESRKAYRNAKPVDNWRWIFKDYAKQGYVTMYSEDSPAVGAFNYRLMGFRDPPTDHYSRYYWLEAENYIQHEHCTGNQAIHNLTFNYLLSLFTTYKKNRPKFSLLNFSNLVHRDPNAITYADSDLVNLLKMMSKGSYLDNTFLLIFGDHGYRFGGMRKQTLQGKLEERLPHFSISVPKWFTRQHRRLYNNLKFNSRLLTSPFDIYATLKHILSYPWSPKYVMPGQSLLSRIDPQKRVCRNVGVRDHWCPCLVMEKVSVKDVIVHELAMFAVSSINEQNNATATTSKLCHPLSLKKVLQASREMPSHTVQTFKFSFKNKECDSCGAKLAAKAVNTMVKDTLYQIQFTTKPSDATYEVTISLNGGVASIDGEISRLDSIGVQADCIKDTYVHLIKFCYCVSCFSLSFCEVSGHLQRY